MRHQESSGSRCAIRFGAGEDGSWEPDWAVVKALLGRSPLPRAYTAMTPTALRVLAYHGVTDVDAFATQVDHLRRHYRPVSLAEVHDALHSKRALPRRAVLVTFDDGDRTVLENALPVLADAGVPAVLYVVGDLIGTDRPFWWDEAMSMFDRGGRVGGIDVEESGQLVRALKTLPDDRRRTALTAMRTDVGSIQVAQLSASELQQLELEGIAIGNHTASHPCLDRCDDMTAVEEIERAHASLAAMLGHEPDTFAYPNGNLDLRAEPVLRRLGYRSAFLFDHSTQTLPADHLRLSRLRVDADAVLGTFALMVSGAHSTLHHRLLRRS